jgi:hypothetical protein
MINLPTIVISIFFFCNFKNLKFDWIILSDDFKVLRTSNQHFVPSVPCANNLASPPARHERLNLNEILYVYFVRLQGYSNVNYFVFGNVN